MAEAYEKNHKTLQIVRRFELDTIPGKKQCAIDLGSTLDLVKQNELSK